MAIDIPSQLISSSFFRYDRVEMSRRARTFDVTDPSLTPGEWDFTFSVET